MIPTLDHFQNFVRYRKANLGHESCDYERTCWDFYSSKINAQWIDNDYFCFGTYPFMDGHAFGFFELKGGTEENQREAWAQTRAQFVGPLYGPINGSTFLPYKFISMTNGGPIFPGEWESAPYVANFFNACRPKKVVKYRSAYRTHFDGVIEVSEPFVQDWYDQGFSLEHIELGSSGTADALLNLIDAIFSGNWGYESMTKVQFQNWLQHITAGSNNTPLLYWVQIKDQKVGFAYLSELPDATIIFKTIGILREFQAKGLGNAIAGQLHKVAKSRNAQKCIYALVQVDNRVNRMPDSDISIMREYETYIF
ncbi:GNAT family N-acetyltransferase [Schleiferiaceae bacterium]|nr:GNAT family N-acetyltransferase [Schleiferiaceae bacterium]